MPIIQTVNGELDTKNIPDYLEPVYCYECGNRIGWINRQPGDPDRLIFWCDECLAERVKEE